MTKRHDMISLVTEVGNLVDIDIVINNQRNDIIHFVLYLLKMDSSWVRDLCYVIIIMNTNIIDLK